MSYQLGDVYIGNYPITQSFGARPDVYSGLYNMKGHNGVDIGCPLLTLIIATADGIVKEAAFDQNGYGNYIKLFHPDQKFLSLYGHLNDIVVKVGDRVVKGQLLGHSNNTGFSSGPHLHFGVAPCDDQGIKTEVSNGYSGYIDPMDGAFCTWNITNPTQPVSHLEATDPAVSISHQEYSIKTIQANNFLAIVNYAQTNGLGPYLSGIGQSIDLLNNPADIDGAKKVNEWIASLLEHIDKLNTAIPQSPVPTLDVSTASPEVKTSLLASLLGSVKGFIFK